MRLVGGPHGPVKDGGRRSAAEAVAVMRPLLGVKVAGPEKTEMLSFLARFKEDCVERRRQE